MDASADLLPGTLDLLILKAVSLGRLHGYGVLLRIQQISGGALEVQQGALYPALYRLERQGLIESEWGTSDNNRRAKFYRLTAGGRARLDEETAELEPARRCHRAGAERHAPGDLREMLKRVRVMWRTLWRSKQVEAEMRDEMRLHIELEAERLRANGLDPDEARRQAHVRFGGVEKFKEEGRDARGFAWLDSVSLDARLGLRMLAKHRWLTVVGGVAMAVAIALGASAFEVIGVLLRDDLPFPGGDRAIAIRYVSSEFRGGGRARSSRVRRVARSGAGRSSTLEPSGRCSTT